MRRSSLLLAVLAMTLVAIAGIAGTASSNAGTGASPRQSGTPGDADGDGVPDTDDQCPNQAGAESAHGCPDADGDGTADSADACPTEKGVPTDGCPAFRVVMNGYLQERAFLYGYCAGGPDCKIDGNAFLKLSPAVTRKLGVSSARLGPFPFVHPCGQGVICAYQHFSRSFRKKLSAYDKAYRNSHGDPLFLRATLTIEMKAPRAETLSKAVRLGPDSNGGRFVICGAGYPRTGGYGRCDGN